MLLDIQLKIVLPSVQPTTNVLAELINFVICADTEAHSIQIEAVFRYEKSSLVRQSYIPWFPTITFGKNIISTSSTWDLKQQDETNIEKQTTRKVQADNNYVPATKEIIDTKTYQFEETQKFENSEKKEKSLNDQILPQWAKNSLRKIEKSDMKLCESGVGGTYFISEDTGGEESRIAVFKPVDEEPGAPNNPKKKSISTTFTPMIEWGKGANREVAAYKLDKGFVGVPETYFVTSNLDGTIKKGSLQRFINNDGDCSDVGASKFDVDAIHRLGIFDVRILNMDRNDENLLVKKTNDGKWDLIPIDHTYAFPNKIDSYFNWQFWNQTKKAFSATNLDYIASIDVISDAKMLLETGLDEETVKNVIGSTILLQKAASRGFNLFQIASMVSGKENELSKVLASVDSNNSLNTFKSSLVDEQTEEKLYLFKNTVEKFIDMHLDAKQVV